MKQKGMKQHGIDRATAFKVFAWIKEHENDENLKQIGYVTLGSIINKEFNINLSAQGLGNILRDVYQQDYSKNPFRIASKLSGPGRPATKELEEKLKQACSRITVLENAYNTLLHKVEKITSDLY